MLLQENTQNDCAHHTFLEKYSFHFLTRTQLCGFVSLKEIQNCSSGRNYILYQNILCILLPKNKNKTKTKTDNLISLFRTISPHVQSDLPVAKACWLRHTQPPPKSKIRCQVSMTGKHLASKVWAHLSTNRGNCKVNEPPCDMLPQ